SFAVTTGSSSQRQAGESTVGTLYGGKTTLGSREYNAYNSQWAYLKQHVGPTAMLLVLGGIDQVELGASDFSGETLLIRVLSDPMLAEQIGQEANQLRQMYMSNPALFAMIM